MAAESRVSLGEGVEPEAAGGQGSSALSRPMREDAPADRMTPHMLGRLSMERR